MEENKVQIDEKKKNEEITQKQELTNQEVSKKAEDDKAQVEKNEDSKFKKVEVKNKIRKEKKKHRLLKVILIIIGILVVAYFIFAMRNFYILSNILKKAENYKNLTNYSYQVNIKDEETEIKYTYRAKDGVTRTDINNITNPERSMILWKDANEKIIVLTGTNTALKTKAGEGFQVNGKMPFQFAGDIRGLSGIGLTALIYSDNVQEKDCYVIVLDSDYKIWVEKDTGLVVQQYSANRISEYINIELNSVTEIYKPDLTGYEVTEQ